MEHSFSGEPSILSEVDKALLKALSQGSPDIVSVSACVWAVQTICNREGHVGSYVIGLGKSLVQ